MKKDSILDELRISQTDFVGKIYDSEINFLSIELKGVYYLNFEGCTFKQKVSFFNVNNQEIDVKFVNCKFESDFEVKSCNFYSLEIVNIEEIKSIKISGGSSFKNLTIKSFENELKSKILFSNVKVEENLDMSNLKIIEGEVKLNFKITNKEKSTVRFEDSLFQSLIFIGSDLGFDANFTNIKIIRLGYFYDCILNKSSFENSDFGNEIVFSDCKFNSYVGFEDVENLSKTKFKISSCLFNGFPHFNRSKIKSLIIEHTTFEKKVSFDFVEMDVLKFYQVTFRDGAFFDYFKINEIEKCDMVTVRTIKRELVNSHNQIDYLKFKAYELEAYKKEKGKSWKDDFILNLNSFSSSNGLDWVKALKFILLTSFVSYLFYLISYLISIKSVVSSEFPNTVEEFLVYYLKFINPLMFLKSPIEDAEKYFFPLLFLLLGKILISYGIYQLIQAFRKFGKNGD